MVASVLPHHASKIDEGADIDHHRYPELRPERLFDCLVAQPLLGDQSAYLQESMPVTLSLHDGVPVAIELPPRVTFEIVEADPVVKGQTASSSYKPAVLSNGQRVMVPPHIQAGTRVVVSTDDGSYVERAKD